MATDSRLKLKSSLIASKRLQSMMLRFQNLYFEAEYKKGLLLHVADTLSSPYLPCAQERCPNEDTFFKADARSPLEQNI